MSGRFADLPRWVVLVQAKRNGPWLVIPPIAPFMLLVRSSAPEQPWLDKIMKAVENVKKAPCLLVQKSIMADALRQEPLVHGLPASVRDHGPRWETFCQFVRLRAAAIDGQYVAVRLLAPGGIVAAEASFCGKKRKPITTGIVPAIALHGMQGNGRHSIGRPI